MAEERKIVHAKQAGPRNPFVLGLLSLLVGAVAGLVGAFFRLGLRQLDVWRTVCIGKAHGWGWGGAVLVIAAMALFAAIAAWLVRTIAPESTGSGIPYVESQLREGWIGNPFHIVWVKLVGGWMAIGGAGLALGREGPTVQIGAVIGYILGGLFRRGEEERHVLLAAGAGAGLATAFNAPIAGAVFVLEELVGAFDVPISIATLGTSVGAIGVARLLLGHSPDFLVPSLDQMNVGRVWPHIVLGVVVGLAGIAYSRAILAMMALQTRLNKIPVEFRAAAVGVVAGLLGWFAPSLIGGGDGLTQQALTSNVVSIAIVVIFLIRFLLGPLSYSAETPGGLFAPMLTIGSQGGLLLGWLWIRLFHGDAHLPQEFAVVGMAAFFTAVVRAPVTGIILVIELVGSSALLLPMLAAAFAAMTVATMVRQPPIYESLRVVR
ncbi:MAG TPA: ClC family H(+)/Cl(-) exchange transporter [Candidatus Sulfotelmatobacter sp.]|nr:ClC family H(+)/Cl(-) exchange transporter [Candidatus Sulfotelmatobacter sp.]